MWRQTHRSIYHALSGYSSPDIFPHPKPSYLIGNIKHPLDITFHFHALKKEMATHYSVLAWRIPGTGEPDGLRSMGSHKVGHDWSNLAAAAADIPKGFPRGSVVKNRPAMQETLETWVRSLGWNDPLEKEVATLSSIPAGIGKEERKKEWGKAGGRKEKLSSWLKNN